MIYSESGSTEKILVFRILPMSLKFYYFFYFYLNLTIYQKEKSTNNLPFSILNYSSTVLQSRIFRLKYYEIQLLPDVEKSTINFRHGEHVRAAGSGAEAVRGEHAQEDPGHRGEAPTHTRQAP